MDALHPSRAVLLLMSPLPPCSGFHLCWKCTATGRQWLTSRNTLVKEVVLKSAGRWTGRGSVISLETCSSDFLPWPCCFAAHPDPQFCGIQWHGWALGLSLCLWRGDEQQRTQHTCSDTTGGSGYSNSLPDLSSGTSSSLAHKGKLWPR